MHWTEPQYLQPQVFGSAFALNRDESRLYYESHASYYYIDRLDSNTWSSSHRLDASWNNLSVARHCWVDPDENILILSSYTNNWQLYISRKDSAGVWGPLRALPPEINSSSHELWGSFSPSGRYLYFERDISGWSGSLLRAEYFNDSTFAAPETLARGEYGINWGGDDFSCTLSPTEDELIFSGYRYWHNEGRGLYDLFSSTLGCAEEWNPITRLEISQDNQFEDVNSGSGIEKYPFLASNNRTLYFYKTHYTETDSGYIPEGGFAFSKRIWSKCTMVCAGDVADNNTFYFNSLSADSIFFEIMDGTGAEILSHADTVSSGGAWRVRWYGIDNIGTPLADGTYSLQIESDSTLDHITFDLVSGDIQTGLGINKEPRVKVDFNLYNYPNPFNPETLIRYDLPEDATIRLIVFDLQGRVVRSLIRRSQVSGHYEIVWDGRDNNDQPVSSGLYIAQLSTVGFTQSIKMVFLN